MSATSSQFETPPLAASLSSEYPQFTAAELPRMSSAVSAWVGEIRPFASDAIARGFLHDLEADRPIWIEGGRVKESDSRERHWADPVLLNMAVRCKVLILVQPPPQHARAYLLAPLFAEHYSFVHPHPRSDLAIEWNGKRVPGLCIYSAAEFRYDGAQSRESQFLDQVTLYVARHLIWLRTRRLVRGYPPEGEVVRTLQPGDLILNDRPTLLRAGDRGAKPLVEYWAGYWPGPVSLAFRPADHLLTIDAGDECWCGTGVPYGLCHRPSDLGGPRG